MEHEKIEIDDNTRKYIIDQLVEPYYKSTVANTINGKTCWRRTGIIFETVSKVMVALGSIMSFSAGYYHDDTLSFISGSISCLSLACLQFSSFSYKENKKQGDELNILLKKLKLDTVPALARDDYISARAQTRSYAPEPFRPRASSQGWANDNQQQQREEALMRELELMHQERAALFAEIEHHEANKIQPSALKTPVNQGDNNSLKSNISYERSADAAAHQVAYKAIAAYQAVAQAQQVVPAPQIAQAAQAQQHAEQALADASIV
jgi:hypothetical protein